MPLTRCVLSVPFPVVKFFAMIELDPESGSDGMPSDTDAITVIVVFKT